MHTPLMPPLQIDKLVATTPIIQGGMGVGISMSGLAVAVANEGGIGVISSAFIGESETNIKTDYPQANKLALKREIRKAREKTRGIIGVNILVALSDFEEHVMGAVEEGADIILMGAGLPLALPKKLLVEGLNSIKTRLIPIVSSAKACRIILKSWNHKYGYLPPAVVVEGPMAGGHLGFSMEQINDPSYALEKIIPAVLSEVQPFEQIAGRRIAVIAAGGVYTGADILKYLQMGASGVQMGTRFVTTHECDASPAFKEAYIKCEQKDIAIIKSPVGMPGRAIKNGFLDRVASGSKSQDKCNWRCLKNCVIKESTYCIAMALSNAKKGALENGFAFAGANAYRAKEIISVKQLIATIAQEYKIAVEQANLLCVR